ncbi:peptidoglycan D,D-transpeptidase FtsI family protein [Oxynema aestuarii]|uniref:Penicillin-binding protein 2 n=1 Tax=Oxynema aestuarii AP17 TaxID=2064643 RepID=A0A6H1U5S5_9CYAN|nr:penicillin-binding protein 2 [Oxynema aestuarii]QIZ72979.1 penicillin-binding protein 2 [Oxynema aestuarii AP17]RMH75144.1 MAG: penicillin-binding protein 2 [Cyanobacteria bacterium J007]
MASRIPDHPTRFKRASRERSARTSRRRDPRSPRRRQRVQVRRATASKPAKRNGFSHLLRTAIAALAVSPSTPSRAPVPSSQRGGRPPLSRSAIWDRPRVRLSLVWGMLLLSSVGLLANLYRLQVISGGNLRQQARQQQNISLKPFVPRRPIVDRAGNVLAIDRPVYKLYAHPKLFTESVETIARSLSPILERPFAEIWELLDRGESGLVVATSISEDAADRIRQLYLDGLELEERQQRLYPYDQLAADIVGYVNDERTGQAGIEYSRQESLVPAPPLVESDRSLGGALIPDPVPGDFYRFDDLRLQLTVDLRLQRAAHQALAAQIKQWEAKRGTVIVMDARDGAILALANQPTYNPNQFYEFDLELFKNWALTDLYEPGSTFKPIAVAIALQAGAIEPDSTFYDEGRIYVDSWPISNYDYSYAGARGTVNVREILRHSSNVGMVRVVEQMELRVFYSWLQRLGIGDVTHADLPFEVASQLRSRQEFVASPVHAATASFGQGFSLTPLQLTQIHGALANGGRLVTPHVVKGLYNADGRLYWQPQRPRSRQVFSPETTHAVVSMMEDVVAEGTGKNAQISGYRIAGKTGTSQKATATGGYSDYAKIASFVGIVPADNPRYVVLAAIDEPKGGSGGMTAAPVVKSTIEALIQVEGIPPSEAIAPE